MIPTTPRKAGQGGRDEEPHRFQQELNDGIDHLLTGAFVTGNQIDVAVFDLVFGRSELVTPTFLSAFSELGYGICRSGDQRYYAAGLETSATMLPVWRPALVRL